MRRGYSFGGGMSTGTTTLDVYQSTANWFIDPISGVDSNAGSSSGTALKTCKELARRLQGRISQPTTVTWLSDPGASDPIALSLRSTWDYSLSASVPTLTLIGTQTTSRSSTITSAGADAVPATNTPTKVTDTNVSDWTSEVGSWVTFASVACIVAKNEGSGVARVSPFYNLTTFAAGTAPSSSASYAVQAPMAVTAPVRVAFDGSLDFKWMNFGTEDEQISCLGSLRFLFCKTSRASPATCADLTLVSCLPTLLGIPAAGSFPIAMNGCLVLNGNMSTTRTLTLTRCLFQGRGLSVGGSSDTGFGLGHTLISIVGFFDVSGTALAVARGGTAQLTGTLFGSGNTTGVAVTTGGQVIVAAAVTPTLAASGSELIIDALVNVPTNLNTNAGTLGALPVVAADCSTWALWVSNHSRNAISYKTGAKAISS